MEKQKKSRKGLIILLVLLILLAAAAAVPYAIVNNYLGKINYASADDFAGEVSFTDADEADEISSSSDIQAASEEEIALLEVQMQVTMEDIAMAEGGDVTNILLLGVDSREERGSGRTDVMMIISINKERETLSMMSLMRDTAVMIPGRSRIQRLNAAHVYGGTALTIKTIEENFKVPIDNYVKLDFLSFIEVVDILGGLELDVKSDRERRIINGYVSEINRKILKIDKYDGVLEEYGDNLLLTGKQTLGYVRNRKTGEGDFSRTGRQREVAEKLLDKIRNCSASQLIEIANTVLPSVTTDMSRAQIFGHILSAGDYLNYDLRQYRVPADGTWSYVKIRQMSMLKIDLEENIEYIHESLYE